MSNIELRNENGKIVAYDLETGNKVPVSFEEFEVENALIADCLSLERTPGDINRRYRHMGKQFNGVSNDDWSGWVDDSGGSLETTSAARLGDSAMVRKDGVLRYELASPINIATTHFAVSLRWDAPVLDSHQTFHLQFNDSEDNYVQRGASIPPGVQGSGEYVDVPMVFRDESVRSPDLTDITTVRVRASGSDRDIKVDNIREYESTADPAVVMHFDDNDETIYTEGWEIMQQYGMTGTLNVISEDVGSNGALSQQQIDELASEGWTVCAHPQDLDANNLTALSESELREEYLTQIQYLNEHGFNPRIITYPFNQWDPQVIEVARDYFDIGFIGGADGVSAPVPWPPMTVPRVNGDDKQRAKAAVDRAVKRNGVAHLIYHTIGSNGAISPDDFQEVIDYIVTSDARVVTAEDHRRDQV